MYILYHEPTGQMYKGKDGNVVLYPSQSDAVAGMKTSLYSWTAEKWRFKNNKPTALWMFDHDDFRLTTKRVSVRIEFAG